MKSFLKYFCYGILGLILRLRFPTLPIEWLAVVAAYAYLERGLDFSLLLMLALSIVYAGFSLAPAWQIFLPIGIALTCFRLLQANFNMMSFGGFFLLLVFLAGAEWLFWGVLRIHDGDLLFPLEGWLQISATTLTGIFILPLLRRLLQILLGSLPRPRRRMGELPWYKAKFKRGGEGGPLRKPFGFEKRF